MKSLLPGMNEADVTKEIAYKIISLPTEIGKHPETGEPVLKDIGRYGPYVKSCKINASVPKDMNLIQVTLEIAIDLIKNHKMKKKKK